MYVYLCCVNDILKVCEFDECTHLAVAKATLKTL